MEEAFQLEHWSVVQIHPDIYPPWTYQARAICIAEYVSDGGRRIAEPLVVGVNPLVEYQFLGNNTDEGDTSS